MTHSIPAIAAQNTSPMSEHATFSEDSVSLDDHMLSELTRMAGQASARQGEILQALNTVGANPDRMVKIQKDLATFQIEMSLAAAFARKAVAVVETLVKS